MSYDWDGSPTPGPVVCQMQIATLMSFGIGMWQTPNERRAMTKARAGYRKMGVGTRVKSSECVQVATVRWFE